MLRKRLLVPLIALLFSGCASITQDETANWTAEEFYAEAKEALDDGNYETAIELYGKLEGRYPYGRYAQQAQLETAYAHYKAGEREAAIAAAERFIKLHPRHPNVDYAYYMRGLAGYQSSDIFLGKLFPQDPSERDPSSLREAFNYFRELVTNFPNSRYAQDSLERMAFLRNSLANHEVSVALYYLNRGADLAASKRAKYVIENYPRSLAIAEALGIMVEAYRHMGLEDLANDSMRVLQKTYPDHEVTLRLQKPSFQNGAITN